MNLRTQLSMHRCHPKTTQVHGHILGECRRPAYHVGSLGNLPTLLTSVIKCCNADEGEQELKLKGEEEEGKDKGKAREPYRIGTCATVQGKPPFSFSCCCCCQGQEEAIHFLHFSTEQSVKEQESLLCS